MTRGTQPRPLRHSGRLNRRGRSERKLINRKLDFIEALLGRAGRLMHYAQPVPLPFRPHLAEPPPQFPFPRMPPLPVRRPPTTRVCGVDVVINAYTPPGWFGWVKDIGLIAHDVASAEAVLGRIVWTDPPCWMGDDGKLVEIPRDVTRG